MQHICERARASALSGVALVALFASAFPVAAQRVAAPVEDIVVTAQRTRNEIVAPGHQITTLEREALETQRNVSDTLSTVLAKSVPGSPIPAGRLPTSARRCEAGEPWCLSMAYPTTPIATAPAI